MTESLSHRFQGAETIRAAAAAIRGEAEDNTRASTAERDLVQAWALEHAELGTEADWQGLHNPSDIVCCVEQAELPGGPYLGGLVLTFGDARTRSSPHTKLCFGFWNSKRISGTGDKPFRVSSPIPFLMSSFVNGSNLG